ncbi:MAG: integrin alpha [Planctomycetota bacterium]|jgi:hypothetical protein
MGRKTSLKALLVLAVFLLDSCGLLRLAMAKGPQADKAKKKQKAKAQLPAGASGNWWSAVQDQIRRAEYQIKWQEKTGLEDLEGAYQAPNRAQNLRTYFVPEGILIVQRTESSPGWQWGLSLRGYGYAGAVKAVDKARLEVSGNRIEYRRGDVVEWYVNDEKGLEQGFTLAGPPEANSEETKSEIVLEMSFAGDLEGRISTDGKMVTFATSEAKEVINYEGLVAKDAAGRVLVSRISLGEDRITLKIDAGGARYPITIDPTITGSTPNWIAKIAQDYERFGCSVATAGDINGDGFSDVIVGAYDYDNGQTNEGAAFVYHGSAFGLSASPDWTAEGNDYQSMFGFSVATAGDVNGDGFSDVIVGAHMYDNYQDDEGKVFVYHGSASGLSTSPDWTAEYDQADAMFGYSVSTAGDVNGDGYCDVIIGASRYDDVGAAFVYHGSASGLSAGPDWMTVSDQLYACFGGSVATAGDVNGDGFSDVIVGAPCYDNIESGEGKAFLYHGSASGLSSNPDWTAEGNQLQAGFGNSVATSGDVNGDGFSDVIIGANGYDNGQTNEGAVFVYHGSAGGLSANHNWKAEGNQDYAHICHAVSAGDVNGDGFADVIVGAPNYDNGQECEGAVFVYHGSASGLSVNPDWTVYCNHAYTSFGVSAAAAGDVNGDGFSDVIVGAFFYSNLEGEVYVYQGSALGLSTQAVWTAEVGFSGNNFGCSVSTAGDVNGDGFDDVIVGAFDYDNGQDEEGMAFVFHSSGFGLSARPNWMAEGNQAGAWFGRSVATAGDVNGDGFDDVIVGALHYENGQYDEGRAFVYHGSSAGLSSSPAWTGEGNRADALFGISVSTAGDVNGDGYCDIIVGASGYNNGQPYEGAVFVYYGSASGLSSGANWMADSDQTGASFGNSVATAGDVNGDGFAETIVGAPNYNNGGAAFVYHGSASGLSASPYWTAEGYQYNSNFGYSVSTAGDVNGDGFSDVIVGAYKYDNGQDNEGKAFVYHGSAFGLSTDPAWTAESNQASAYFGYSVATAGDINGGGFSDVIVGASFYDNGENNEGAAFVYYGSAAGLSAGPAWTAESNQAYACLGWSVATAGDINSDGLSDVIVGVIYYDVGGAAFAYYGKCWLKADITGNCYVDFFDFAKLANDWLEWSFRADLTGDNFVDYFDLDVLALYWLGENNPPPGAASNPNPPDGASLSDFDADLSWTAGVLTESHDVYFGTSSPPPFVGNQIATTLDPGTMTIGAKYYWRINEVGPYTTTKGTVWSFTIMTPPPPPP